MNKQISVLGTGWLGLPLAKALLKENYIIKGSSTTESKLGTLRNDGINPYLLEMTEDGPKGNIQSFLDGSNILIINVPPGLRRNPEGNFVTKIKKLVPLIEKSTIKKVVFISSTSVFSDEDGFPLITPETTPNAITNAGKQLIEVEKLLQENKKFHVVILRFAGLFDSRRHPATMLSKRKDIKNPLAPVNLIHREDCIGIIEKIIKIDRWDKTYNASYPDHPKKSAYYSAICKQMELPVPDYDFDTPSKGKIIDSKKLQHNLQYSFKRNLYLFS